jgi:hypothetical protein
MCKQFDTVTITNKETVMIAFMNKNVTVCTDKQKIDCCDIQVKVHTENSEMMKLDETFTVSIADILYNP